MFSFVKAEISLFLQVFVRKVIELHDKYLAYVNDCFQNHTLFHKVMIIEWLTNCYVELKCYLKVLIIQALKEAFEIFCNKGVAGSSSAELLATFCDNILKKGGSEKLSDEAIEETLEKVCISLNVPHTSVHLILKVLKLGFLLVHLQVVKLLAYISDKDLFAEFYR